MFPITRMAIAATKYERKSIKLINKALKYKGPAEAKEAQSMITDASEAINKKIENYSKNPLKRMTAWIKSFIEYYKLIKNNIKNKTNELKTNYGKLFTKKRQKFVKTKIIKSIKGDLAYYKDVVKEAKNGLKEMKKEFKAAQKAQK